MLATIVSLSLGLDKRNPDGNSLAEEGFMLQRDVWSISLGRWFGFHLRIHMFFLLFATFTLYLAWRVSGQFDGLTSLAVVCLLVLFVSVIIHEAAHCFAALKLGGSVDSIVLGPLGGLRGVDVAHDPQSELLAVLAGPIASLLVCLCCLAMVAVSDASSVRGLLNPLAPSVLVGAQGELSVATLIRMACWVNWLLVVVNMIPAFPFDGGRACQAFIQSVRPDIDKATAVTLAAYGAKIVAVLLLVLAIVFRDSLSITGVPSWLPLIMLSIFVFFSTRVEESQSDANDIEDVFFGYDFSQGYTSLERSIDDPPVPEPQPQGKLSSWLQRRQVQREQRRIDEERNEEERMDDILRRLHEHGYEQLSAADRSLLKRVSQRYRSRQDG